MTDIILCGCCGNMGKTVTAVAEKNENCNIVAGIDKMSGNACYPIVPSFDKLTVKGDVIVDFSHPSLLPETLKYAVNTKTPAVIATTGLAKDDIDKIKDASKRVAIFFSFNMSLGINLLVALAKKAACALSGFDIEIVEKHHNRKIDAPSGTAIMLADEINHTLGDDMVYEYDRHSRRSPRKPQEIGIHSVRGGTIVGEHEVIFAGNDEVVTLKHEAFSKNVFAVGALNAARYIVGAEPGMYDMSSLV